MWPSLCCTSCRGPDLACLPAALVSFVAPDLLGPLSAFKRIFAEPIMRAQDRDATEEEREVGAARAR